MRVSDIEELAKVAFGCEGYCLDRKSKNAFVRSARNAVAAVLTHLGYPDALICKRYGLSHDRLIAVVNEFNREVRSVRCDNDIAYFLKLLKQKLHGDKI